MRQSDIFSIILIAGIGTLVAFILCNILLGDPNEKSETFKTIDVIQADLAQPDPEIFNYGAINPTVEVYVGRCQDYDQNGILDNEELTTCAKERGEDIETQEDAL